MTHRRKLTLYTRSVSVKNLKKSLTQSGEGEKWFAPAEMGNCMKRARPYEGLAARLALKQLLTRWSRVFKFPPFSYQEIGVVSREGRPRLCFYGRSRSAIFDLCLCSVHFSLSHTRDRGYALLAFFSE